MLLRRTTVDKHARYVFSCDACGAEMVRARKSRKNSLDVCSLECLSSKRSSIDDQTYRSLDGSLRRMGTMKKRYGGAGTFAASTLSAAARRTMLDRYGSLYPQSLSGTKAATVETNVLRYGHANNVHGSCNVFVTPFLSEETQTKARRTVLERYGNGCAANSGDAAKFDKKARYARAYETKRRTGKLKTSSQELIVRKALLNSWGAEGIIVHPFFNGWSFDMFIVSIRTFVQVDGTYWHGLDRSIEDIEASEKSIDKAIARKWYRDRDQNNWFANCTTDERLVRLTDIEVDKNDLTALLKDKGLIA